ncbi:MAG TPA: GNAT family N-acetyltransferase [Polyangiaceae bacterium]|nr:GNAT family N-acetyltransferase [Polyangiaceae bacterium]
MYSVRVLERVGDLPRATWNALVGDESSPFVEHEWLDALEQSGCVGGSTGWIPLHLSLWRDSELVAVAPAYAKEHSEGEFVFDWSWAELAERWGIRYYPKIVVAVPFTPATGDRVLVAQGEDRGEIVAVLAGALRELCGRIGAAGVHVLFPREDETAAWVSSGYLRRDGIQFHWFRRGALTFDDYMARFSSKQRNQIRREIRRVRESGIVVETLVPEAHTPEAALAMYRFYASTIDKHGMWGRLYLNELFFQLVIDRFRHRLAWVVARDTGSGEIVGGAFNVVKDRRLYGRYWGARADIPFLHFVVCYYAGVQCCIDRGLDAFEPGAGGEHKRARGFVPTLTRSAHWLSDRRLRSALAPWLERERARVRQLVEEGPGPEPD